jgi:tRNA (guanine-N7-)-methyltransferase
MSKNKLAKFAEMETFDNVFQVSSASIRAGAADFRLKGRWRVDFFGNQHPITLELGCGRGEYTVGLAQMFPERNFIGIDIKGARMWAGAKQSQELELKNVAFVRTDIEMLTHFFAENEVDEIWLTFPDPQMKKTTKRLTSTNFMHLYQQFMADDGLIHLKTDSNFMFTYTNEMIKVNNYDTVFYNDDLYSLETKNPALKIKTYYEQQWLARGLTIKYVCFKLEKKATFAEPNIDIEKDNYRSKSRNV